MTDRTPQQRAALVAVWLLRDGERLTCIQLAKKLGVCRQTVWHMLSNLAACPELPIRNERGRWGRCEEDEETLTIS